MPAKPLSNIQEVIELTLFHAIRLEVVSQGYLPDIMSFADTPAGSAAYEAAIQAVVTAKGFCCEVFNNSNPDDKGVKKIPRITLKSEMYMPGDVGGDSSRTYVEHINQQGTKYFSAHIRPPMTVDFGFNIHLLCNNASQYRLMNSMLANAIPLRGYVPVFQRAGLNTETYNIFVENISFNALPISRDDFAVLEYVLRYQVKDVFLVEFMQDLGNVAALNEIVLNLQDENRRVLETLTLP